METCSETQPDPMMGKGKSGKVGCYMFSYGKSSLQKAKG